MSSEPQHHASKRKIFDFIVIPSEDANRTKKYRLSKIQLIAGFLSIIIAMVTIVVVILVYTPVGNVLPYNAQTIDEHYGKQFYELNSRVAVLMEELLKLQSYNVQLRKALGEKVEPDSSLIARAAARSRTLTGTPPKTEQLPTSQQPPQQVRAPQIVYVNMSGNPTNIRVSFPAVLPMEGFITRKYDPSIRHYGIDFGGKIGTTVSASADGFVVFAGYTVDDGYMVILSHSGGFLTFYKHNASLLVESNTYVKRGDALGFMGNTGRASYGPHLHFELWKDGSPVNPADYLINKKLS
jgi:murein DD-endopeptidase MepM/ murein hydrolase activator NlpD